MVEYLEKNKDNESKTYSIDTVNETFLEGRTNIRVNQRMTNHMDEEEKQRFLLMQMTQFPEMKGSL